MTSNPQNQILASDLKIAKQATKKGVVLKTSDIPRAVRERLQKTGWLQQIILGYYALVNLEEGAAGETYFYPSFYDFLSVYLNEQYPQN